MAIAAFVTGAAAVVLGWVPFVFVLAGLLGNHRDHLRHPRSAHLTTPRWIPDRGFAVAGLVLAPIALIVCVAGFFFTKTVVHEIRDFIEPGPHEVVIDTCTADGGRATVHGTIRNIDTLAHDYRIVVEVDNGSSTANVTVPVPEVAAVRPHCGRRLRTSPGPPSPATSGTCSGHCRSASTGRADRHCVDAVADIQASYIRE